jgi:hypothetical protein
MPKPIDAPRRPPSEPTVFLPGTAGKILEMAARHEAGLDLYHPRDAVMDPDGLARVAVLNPDCFNGKGGTFQLGWVVVDERAYRRKNHNDQFFEFGKPEPSARTLRARQAKGLR